MYIYTSYKCAPQKHIPTHMQLHTEVNRASTIPAVATILPAMIKTKIAVTCPMMAAKEAAPPISHPAASEYQIAHMPVPHRNRVPIPYASAPAQ